MSIMLNRQGLTTCFVALVVSGSIAVASDPEQTILIAGSSFLDRLLLTPINEDLALGMLQDEAPVPVVPPFRKPTVFRARAQLWLPELDGMMNLEDTFGVGTTLDFTNDLGVDDPDSDFAWDVGVQLGGLQLRLSGFTLASAAIETAGQTVTFGDITINIGELIDTQIDVQNYKLQAGFSLLNPADHGIGVAFSLGVDLYQVEAIVVDVTDTVSDRIDETLPIPIVGVHLELPIDTLLVTLDVSGFSIEIEDIDVSHIDASVALAWMPLPGVSVVGGYRIIDTELTQADFQFDATLEGPFFGVEIRF